VVSLIIDMLQDPDYKDDIDWSGCTGKAEGEFGTIGSGDWYREVQV
jgi:hypothetical protein